MYPFEWDHNLDVSSYSYGIDFGSHLSNFQLKKTFLIFNIPFLQNYASPFIVRDKKDNFLEYNITFKIYYISPINIFCLA